MAVVSKQEVRVLDETFIKIVKYSANTEKFTIELPEGVHKKVGKAVEGGTLKEVNARFSYAIQAYKESSTKKEKVIMVKLNATITGKSNVDNKRYKLEDVGWHNEGVAISLSCGVFTKHTTKIPHNEDRVDYEYIEAKFPPCFRKIKDEWLTRGDYIELSWSKEYEALFKGLADGMMLLVFKLLAAVGTKKGIDKFMISGQKLLTE